MLEEQTIGYLVGELGGPGSLSEEILSVHVKEQLSSFCLERTFSEFQWCLSFNCMFTASEMQTVIILGITQHSFTQCFNLTIIMLILLE